MFNVISPVLLVAFFTGSHGFESRDDSVVFLELMAHRKKAVKRAKVVHLLKDKPTVPTVLAASADALPSCDSYFGTEAGTTYTEKDCGFDNHGYSCRCDLSGGNGEPFITGVCVKKADGYGCVESGAVAQCYDEYDIARKLRPEGSSCLPFEVFKEGGDTSGYKCLMSNDDGSPSPVLRCANNKLISPCQGKKGGMPGDSCGGGKKCWVNGTFAPVCLSAADSMCLGKPDGTDCKHPDHLLSVTSKCSGNVCLEPAIGACEGQDEGTSCEYTEITWTKQCDHRRRRANGGIYQIKNNAAGTCSGAERATRSCEDTTLGGYGAGQNTCEGKYKPYSAAAGLDGVAASAAIAVLAATLASAH